MGFHDPTFVPASFDYTPEEGAVQEISFTRSLIGSPQAIDGTDIATCITYTLGARLLLRAWIRPLADLPSWPRTTTTRATTQMHNNTTLHTMVQDKSMDDQTHHYLLCRRHRHQVHTRHQRQQRIPRTLDRRSKSQDQAGNRRLTTEAGRTM